MQALVTGTAGLIGSHIAQELLARGMNVVGVDSYIGGYKDNVPEHPRYKHHAWDARTMEPVQCDIVFHCAALAYEGLSVFSPQLISENIVSGTMAAAVAAIRGGAKTFINFSSMARYGAGRPPFCEFDVPKPVDPYGISKLAAEHLLNTLGATHGMKVVHIVPHNVIGPGQRYDDPYRNVVGIMLNRAMQDKSLIVYGDGHQTRCFSFVQDVIPTVLQIAFDEKAGHGETFNVGPDDGEISVLDLARLVSRICEVEPRIEHLADRPCEVKHAWCSSDKIRQRYTFKRNTSLYTGICAMRDWIKKRGTCDFDYSLPIELINSPLLPEAWKRRSL